MPAPKTEAATDHAVWAAMELLDCGWAWSNIALALGREEAWVRAEVEAAIGDDARASGPLN